MNLRFVVVPGGPSIILTEHALLTMNRFRQISPQDTEAGGQLFAILDGIDTVIVEATLPKWLDKRSRYGFRPNRWLQQREIQDRYTKGQHFVGDWHTHPEPIPKPSKEDIRNITECFRSSHHDLHAFVTIIVGTAPIPQGFYVALFNDVIVRELIIESSIDGYNLYTS